VNNATDKAAREPQIDTLIEALQNGLRQELTDQEVAALLGWIASSSRNPGAQALNQALGPSGDNEALTGHAFSLLDEAIFAGETLLTGPAGVSEERENDARRRRYRLLLSAFHPDRYPARADWLTSRSQVITRAYARFKTGQTDELPAVAAPPPAANPGPSDYRGITPTWRLAERLRSRWGQDRFLAHKIIGILALFLLLPVISILLDQQIRAPDDDQRPAKPRIDLDALDLRVERWPLPDLTAPWLAADQSDLAVADPEPVTLPESLWDSFQAASSIDLPEWLDRARVGYARSTADSPGIQMLAFLSESWDQIDELIATTEASEALPQPERRPPNAEPAREPRDRNASSPAPAAPVASATPNRSERPSDQPGQVEPPLPGGSINLGPLSNHQVGDLLNDYRSSIEAGDLEGLLDVLGREPRDNHRVGRGWFEQHYRELFNASSQRSLSLQILNATRHGQGWRVTAQYQLDMRDVHSGQNDRMERDVEFVILPDPFRLKIVAVEY